MPTYQDKWQSLGLWILSKVPARCSIGLRDLRACFPSRRMTNNMVLEGVSWLSNQGWVYLLQGKVVATPVGRKMLDSKHIGKRFRFWTVLAVSDLKHERCPKPILWCRCSCGTVREVRLDSLRDGRSRSCGCRTARLISASRSRHGGKTRSPATVKCLTYTTWQSMKRRAQLARSAIVPNWENFEGFRKNMGDRPFKKAVLIRIDEAKPWGPSNVLWGDRRYLGSCGRQRERAGERFGSWRVISVQGIECWSVCDCGTIARVSLNDLTRGESVHCDNPLATEHGRRSAKKPPPRRRAPATAPEEVAAFRLLTKIRQDSTWATLSRELDMSLDDLHAPMLWLASHRYVTMAQWQVTDPVELTAKGKMACKSSWIDRQVGFWHVLAVSKPPPRGLLWCACRCGRVKEVEQDDLRDKRSLSCGCDQIC